VLFSILDSDDLTPTERDRGWALATHHFYFNDAEKVAVSQDMSRTESILLKLKREGSSDEDVDAALASDYLEAGMIEPAEQLALAILDNGMNQRESTIVATDIVAKIALQRQDNAVAMQRFEQLIQMRRNAGDHYLLGICLINAGRLQEATVSLLESLRIDPLLELAHEQLAAVFQNQGEMSRAESHVQALRQIRSYRHKNSSNAP
jgi:Tfp pilus assembly protein PilF